MLLISTNLFWKNSSLECNFQGKVAYDVLQLNSIHQSLHKFGKGKGLTSIGSTICIFLLGLLVSAQGEPNRETSAQNSSLHHCNCLHFLDHVL
jgi:hypothetical protein